MIAFAMGSLPLLAAILLLAACGGSSHTQIASRPATNAAFRYTEGSAAYRVTSTDSSLQTTPGQRRQSSWSSTQHMTFTIAAHTPDTLRLTVRVDSAAMHRSETGAVDMSRLVGSAAHAAIAPNGRVLHVDSSAAIDAALAVQLVHFLPHVKGPLEPGTVWADTVDSRVVQGGVPISRRIITTQTVMGDTVINGRTGRRILRDTKITMEGSGAPGGDRVLMTGTGTGTGVTVVTLDGVFLAMALSNSFVMRNEFPDLHVFANTTARAASVIERVPDSQ
jgi:hypothetical protein